jgi:hypothetical protein
MNNKIIYFHLFLLLGLFFRSIIVYMMLKKRKFIKYFQNKLLHFCIKNKLTLNYKKNRIWIDL